MPADPVTSEHPTAELAFRAMGSDAHVIVVGHPSETAGDVAELALRAPRRIAELEHRWSRFEADSEVSALTRHAGSPVLVSPETLELVERAVAAWRMTRGRFDPTVLGALVRAGYDRSFDDLGPTSTDGQSSLETGAGAIEIVAGCVRLPRATGFDAGGIGKGLAADIVADELGAAGAAGVCINLGGDVRVAGTGPTGNAWTVAVEHPHRDHPIAQVGIAQGAVATSTTLRRQWFVDGELRHHLIDPVTGRPSNSDLTFVTVVAGHAWTAEVLAKATLLAGTSAHFDLLAASGAEALAVDRYGRVTASSGIDAYLSAALPDTITPETQAPVAAGAHASAS